MHDAVVGVVERHAVAHHGVAVAVMRQFGVERRPGAEVAPSEGRGAHIDVVGFFHDGIVDGDVFAVGKFPGDGGALLRSVVEGEEIFEDARNGRRIDAEGIDDGGNTPNEDAGVPEIIGLCHIALRSGQIGLFAKTVDGVDVLLARGGIAEVGLDVAVAGGGAIGVDAERDDGVGLGGELNTLTDALREGGGVAHIVVGGRNNECGSRIALLDAPGGIADAGGRAAHAGFEQDVVARHVGELLGHDCSIAFGGDHPDVFGRDNAGETVDGELQHGAPAAENVEKLLGAGFAAHGPETTADAAGHDDEVDVGGHGERGGSKV